MNLHILKTNVDYPEDAAQLELALLTRPSIQRMSIDLEDVDRVLKIESNEMIQQEEILQLIRGLGYECEDLPE